MTNRPEHLPFADTIGFSTFARPASKRKPPPPIAFPDAASYDAASTQAEALVSTHQHIKGLMQRAYQRGLKQGRHEQVLTQARRVFAIGLTVGLSTGLAAAALWRLLMSGLV